MATMGLILVKEGRTDDGAETYVKAAELARRLKKEALADAIAIKKSIILLAAGRDDQRKVVSAFERESTSDMLMKLLQYEASRVLSNQI